MATLESLDRNIFLPNLELLYRNIVNYNNKYADNHRVSILKRDTIPEAEPQPEYVTDPEWQGTGENIPVEVEPIPEGVNDNQGQDYDDYLYEKARDEAFDAYEKNRVQTEQEYSIDKPDYAPDYSQRLLDILFGHRAEHPPESYEHHQVIDKQDTLPPAKPSSVEIMEAAQENGLGDIRTTEGSKDQSDRIQSVDPASSFGITVDPNTGNVVVISDNKSKPDDDVKPSDVIDQAQKVNDNNGGSKQEPAKDNTHAEETYIPNMNNGQGPISRPFQINNDPKTKIGPSIVIIPNGRVNLTCRTESLNDVKIQDFPSIPQFKASQRYANNYDFHYRKYNESRIYN